MSQDQLHPPFRINYVNMQKMFDTQNLLSGESYTILKGFGDIQGLMEQLYTDEHKGIGQDNSQRKFKFGENRLKPPELTPFIRCVIKQTRDFCIRILALASIIMFILAIFSSDPFDQFVQAMSILIAIMAVVVIGALTDYRKEKQFIELFLEQERQQKKTFLVYRNGQASQMDHTELQVGDIAMIKPGDNVTVDCILIEGSDQIEVDESMITGLTDTLKKQPIKKGKDCFLRGGSNIFEGTAKVLVVAVGESTYSNRMKSSDQEKEDEGEIIHDEQSPLSKALETLAKFLVFIGCMSALVMFIVLELYMVRELNELQQKLISRLTLMKVLSDFIAAFLIIVLSIPEGLPLIVTLSLAFSIAQMKKKGVIIRNLHVAQVLGGIDTVIFDKTGTLTYNNLSVKYYHGCGEDLSKTSINDPTFRLLAEAILATNQSFLPDDQLEIKSQSSGSSKSSSQNIAWNGNKIDVAMMLYMETKFQRDFVVEYMRDLKDKHRKTVPMSMANYHTEFLQIRGDQYRIIIKGRSKDIIDKCNRTNIKRPENRDQAIYEPGNFVFQNCTNDQFNFDLKDIENKAIHNFQTQSLKTCSFAYKDVQIQDIANCDIDSVLFDNEEFIFVGTIAMTDDIRDQAKRLDSAIKMGGMGVCILTGDTRVNAVNVCNQLGWVNQEQADNEIQRISEHLAKSSSQHPQQQQQEQQSNTAPQTLSIPGVESQQVKSDIIQLNQEDIPLIVNQQSVEPSQFAEPLIINFQEYVIRIRKILHQSKIYFTHSEVNEKNIVSKLEEIIEDDLACKNLKNMNRSLQILADLNQHQKHQFLDVYSQINEATIAYVGDGNNDALALRAAHVGFTLGKTATNVAKECSGVILMEDYLEGIEVSIKWGRNIFLNIKRFIYFQLSFFLTSITLMLTASIFFKQQPYSVLQVIWLSLVQDIFSAIALSTEHPQKTILKKTKPTRRKENLIDAYLLQMTVSQALFQYFATVVVLFTAPAIFDIEPSYNHNIYELGGEFQVEWAVHYTVVYHLTAMFQIVNLCNSRRIGHNEYNIFKGIKKNKPFLVMILGLIIAEQCIVYLGDRYFKTAKLTMSQNLFCIAVSIGSLFMFWIAKSVFSEKRKNLDDKDRKRLF